MTSSDHDRCIDDSPVLQRQRSRRLFWKIIAGMVAVVVILIAGIYIKAFWNSPDPKVDYLAQLNAPILAIPEEDRAWPIYREAIIRFKVRDMAMYPGEGKEYVPPYVPTDDGMTLEEIWGSGPATKSSPAPATTTEPRPAQSPVSEPHDEKLEEHYTGSPVRIKPDEKRWPQAAAAMDAHAELYKAIREAGRKSALGLPLAHTYFGEDALVFSPDHSGSFLEGQMQDHSLADLYSPFADLTRVLARYIIMDVHYAAHQTDWVRVVANMQAISDLAKHLHQPRLLAHDIYAYLIAERWMETYSDLAAEHSHDIPDHTLAELALILQSWPSWKAEYLRDEIIIIKDELQHIYSPNGRLTYQGLTKLHATPLTPHKHPLIVKWNIDKKPYPPVVSAILFPLLASTTASHDQMLHEYEKLRRMALHDAASPMWEYLRTNGVLGQHLIRWQAQSAFHDRYWLIQPSSTDWYVTLLSLKSSDAWRDAYLTAIALERYHRRENHYPSSLQLLVPDFLPEHPVDHSTGQPLLYKIVNDKPLLYGRGMDGDDDGGLPGDTFYMLPTIPVRSGDWLFFPMPMSFANR